jgi:hypothetical protein
MEEAFVLIHIGKLDWEGVNDMTPFERRKYLDFLVAHNKRVEERMKR